MEEQAVKHGGGFGYTWYRLVSNTAILFNTASIQLLIFQKKSLPNTETIWEIIEIIGGRGGGGGLGKQMPQLNPKLMNLKGFSVNNLIPTPLA